jgi:hypothetical protein
MTRTRVATARAAVAVVTAVSLALAPAAPLLAAPWLEVTVQNAMTEAATRPDAWGTGGGQR